MIKIRLCYRAKNMIRIKNKNKTYNIDKVILEQIPWFRKMLDGNFIESSYDVINLDFDINAWEKVIEYIHREKKGEEITSKKQILSKEEIMDNFNEEYNGRMLYKYLDMKNMVEEFDIIVKNMIFDNMYAKKISKITWDGYHEECKQFNLHDHSNLWNILGKISQVPYYWTFVSDIIYFFHNNGLFLKKYVDIIILYPQLIYLTNFLLRFRFRSGNSKPQYKHILDDIFDNPLFKDINYHNFLFEAIPLEYDDIRIHYGNDLKYCIGYKINSDLMKNKIVLNEELALIMIFTRYEHYDSKYIDILVSNYGYLLELYDIYHMNGLNITNIQKLLNYGKSIHIFDPISNLNILQLITHMKYGTYYTSLFNYDDCINLFNNYLTI